MKPLLQILKIFVLVLTIWFVAGSVNSVPFEHRNSTDALYPFRFVSDAHTRIDPGISEDIISEFDPAIHKLMDFWELPGVSFAYSHHGRIICKKGYGFSDRDSIRPVTTESLFRIASVSKLITAAAVLKLKEMGKLSLDQKVFGPYGVINDSIYWDARDQRVYDITVRHLLFHQGGWTTIWGDQMFMPSEVARQLDLDRPPTLREIVAWALSKKLHFTPGTATYYSNLGYAILGMVVEHASGMDYESFVRTRLLKPLGITDMVLAGNMPGSRPKEVTYYTDNDSLVAPFFSPDTLVPLPYGANDIETLGAAGGWLATAADLCLLVSGIDRDPSVPDILSKESVRFLEGLSGSSRPAGWKYRERDGDLIRTGSFAGTFAMIKHSARGDTWVFLTNMRPWIGSDFSIRVEQALYKPEKMASKILESRNYYTANP